MKLLKHSKITMLLIISLMGVGLLTACGGSRQSQNTATPAVPQATSARPAATLPPATSVPPTATSAQATAPAQSTATHTPTPAPAVTATAQPDKFGDALDQLLQKLGNANSAGDSLSDVPELK